MGHERSATTLALYTRCSDGEDRILRALGAPDKAGNEVRGTASDLLPLRCESRVGAVFVLVGDTGIEPVTSTVSILIVFGSR
jgi:hypothetical protein